MATNNEIFRGNSIKESRKPDKRAVKQISKDMLIFINALKVALPFFQILLNRLGTITTDVKATAVIEKYDQAILMFDEAIEGAFLLLDFEYRRPYNLKNMLACILFSRTIVTMLQRNDLVLNIFSKMKV